MINCNTLKAAALATTCLTPLAAFADEPWATAGDAQYSNEIGIGVMGVGGGNTDQAGRYNGLTTNGFDVLGEFGIHSRPVWNSGNTWYYDFTGDNLVFQTGDHLGSMVGSDANYTSSTSNNLANSGDLEFSFGKQGTSESHIYYDAISYTGNVIDSLYTASNGNVPALNNNLAPWGGATATAAGPVTKTALTIPALMATGAMLPFQMGTRRDIIGADEKYIYGDWTFTAALRHEHKEGTMEESFDGPWGGTAFALPIDYTTDRYDVAAAYNTRLNQASLQYTYSHFDDANSFVNLAYPWSNTAAPFRESAAYSTPPSNDAHYLTLMAASNMVPNTRINANARFGLELQDAAFAPDTADPTLPVGSLLNGANQGTTSNSPNISATVFQGKVSVDSHPIAFTDANLYYGYDARDVSMNQYKVYSGGTGGASDTSFNSALYVVPQNWLKQDAGVDLAYHIVPQYDTKVMVGYRFDGVDRSNAQVGSSTTDTESIALLSRIGPPASGLNGKLSYEHADRSGSLNYLTPWSNLSFGVPNNTTAGLAYSGAYYQAPMTSDAVTLRGNYAPMENFSGGLFLKFRNENYTYPAAIAIGSNIPPLTGVGEGIKQDYNLTVGPDINYRPREDVNLHLFYTFEEIFYNNLGNGACSEAVQAATAACAGTVGYFQNKYTSDVNTIGLSGDWKVTDQLKLGAEYTLSVGSVMFGEFNGVFVPPASATNSYQNVANYPDVNSTMHNLKLSATYALAPNMDLLLQGTYSYYHNNSFNDTANAIQGAGTTAVSIITPGYSSPNWSVVTIMTGMKFKF